MWTRGLEFLNLSKLWMNFFRFGGFPGCVAALAGARRDDWGAHRPPGAVSNARHGIKQVRNSGEVAGHGRVRCARVSLKRNGGRYFFFVHESVMWPSVISLLFSSQEYSRSSWPGCIKTKTRVFFHGLLYILGSSAVISYWM
jgi:hypothetical protein